MALTVYDYRTDVRSVLVTPQIRSRFMRLEAGEAAEPHSHDLGHEIFLVLDGRAEFTIDSETGEVGPGQMCVALVDQLHSLRVLGDKPMTMYLFGDAAHTADAYHVDPEGRADAAPIRVVHRLRCADGHDDPVRRSA